MTDLWPLSAAATRLLRAPRTNGRELLKLALKELVLRGAWRIERQEHPRRIGGVKQEVHLLPGERPAPDLPPLALLDRRLRDASASGGGTTELARLVKLLGVGVGGEVRDDARAELERRGLIEVERRKALGIVPRTKVALTPSGESWQAGSYEREERVQEDVRTSRPGLGVEAAALGGLVLLLSPAPLAELDEALRRGGEAAYHGGSPGDGGGFGDGGEGLDLSGLDLGILDAIGDLGPTFDGAFDAAVDAGGGGDGGGGGGDGGGGGS